VLHALGRQGPRIVLVILPTHRQPLILNLGRLAPRWDIVVQPHLSLGRLGLKGGRRNDQGPQPGPSGALGGPSHPPPGFQDFIDLTADVDTEEDIDAKPGTPSPNVSEDSSDDSSAMATDDEEELLA